MTASFMGDVAVHVVTTLSAQDVPPEAYASRVNFIDDTSWGRLRELGREH